MGGKHVLQARRRINQQDISHLVTQAENYENIDQRNTILSLCVTLEAFIFTCPLYLSVAMRVRGSSGVEVGERLALKLNQSNNIIHFLEKWGERPRPTTIHSCEALR